MPPGKKTKNTLACVFTVANVLGTCQRYHRPLLIYRCDFAACEQRMYTRMHTRNRSVSFEDTLPVADPGGGW